jgi:hypothetical protein
MVTVVRQDGRTFQFSRDKLSGDDIAFLEKSVGGQDSASGDSRTNSIGMRFVPVPIIGGPTEGKTVLFSIWETRVGDFRAFVKAAKAYRYESTTGYTWEKPGVFKQTDAHPVTLVNWEDAQAFCKWLTDTERAAGQIEKNDIYRLPTDHEWSCAAGIGDREDPTADPSAKRGKIPGFVWGHQWPPGKEVANLASEEVKKLSSNSEVIPGYSDGFAFTAPVGSYPASDAGLFDLAGNVAEWCADPPRKDLPPTSNAAKFRVTRGGNWSGRREERLLASYRGDTPMDARSHGTGFRVVLALAEGPLVEKALPKSSLRFRCTACGLVYEKCSSCGLGPESHGIVNHPPVHEGCNGYGKTVTEK